CVHAISASSSRLALLSFELRRACPLKVQLRLALSRMALSTLKFSFSSHNPLSEFSAYLVARIQF
ncbi:hypothetical protein, partial [Klebsiella pneumoniae]|uniref:hypothetical protein n=1 Tax=Klebsiella pneumoniae TaxID=573 RepID=UPI001F4A91A5